MPIPNNQQPVPAILEQVVSAYPMQRRYASGMLPVWQAVTPRDSYKVAKFSKKYLKPEDFKRAYGAESKRYREGIEAWADIVCQRYGIEAAVDWAEYAGAVDPVRTRLLNQESRIKMALEKLLNSIEAEQVAFLTNPSTYQGNHEALTGASKWDDPACDIIAEVEEYKQTVKTAVGVFPNQMVISEAVWLKVRRKSNLLDKLPTTALRTGLTPEIFGELVGIKNIIIGDTMQSPSDKLEYTWGKSVAMCYNPPSLTDPEYQPVFGITVLRPLGYAEIRAYQDDARTSDVIAADRSIGWGVVSPKAGFLLTNTIS